MKNIAKMVTIAILTSGCAANGYVSGADDPELVCQDRQVTVNHAPAFLVAYPEYLVVCPGQQIVVNIVPAVPSGSAATAPAEKNPGLSGWLQSENREGGRIVLQIPEGTVAGEYKYSITIEGVGTLDPRVRISR
jgi:hypothetical protein